MSVSAAPSVMVTAFGVYHEDAKDQSFVEAERIRHLIPLLAGRSGERAEDAPINASVMEAVESLRDDGGGEDAAQVLPIRWRGESEASIRAQLQPVLLHYRLQILMVQERTQRRALDMKETNERVPLVADYYKSTPVKWRLMGYMGTAAAQAGFFAADSESMFRTPGSAITSLSEVKRDQQIRETFQRFEETMMRQSVGNSEASTPMRRLDGGRGSVCARDSASQVAFSPLPVDPKAGREEHLKTPTGSEEDDGKDAPFDSTVAFVDPRKRK